MAEVLTAQALKLKELFRHCSHFSHAISTPQRNGDGSFKRDEDNKIIRSTETFRTAAPDQAFEDHLAGKRLLGLVPTNGYGTTWVGGIDIDDCYGKPAPDGYPDWAAYYEYRCVSLNLKLNSTLTSSGGVRLLAFFEQPVPSHYIRRWMRHNAVSVLGLPEATEIFPKQDRVSEDSLGNVMFLPWFGDCNVPDDILFAELPPELLAAQDGLEEKEEAKGLVVRKDFDVEAALTQAGLKFNKSRRNGAVYFNYHGIDGQGCLLKGSVHGADSNYPRCCSFRLHEEKRLLAHLCFHATCQAQEHKTRTALEALGIPLHEVIDVDYDYSDQALVGRWALTVRGEVLYLTDDHSWWAYKDRWQEIDSPIEQIGKFLQSLSPGLPESIEQREGETAKQVEGRLKAIHKLHYKLNSQKLASSLLVLAKGKSLLHAEMQEFDADPWLLGCPGGMALDLRSGQTRLMSPDDMITKVLPCAPGGDCPTWKRYLETSLPDPGIRSYLQRQAGYFLTAETREQDIYFFIGVPGAGKDIYRQGMAMILGPYYSSLSLAALLESTNEYQRLTLLAGVIGARLVSIPEGSLKKSLNNEILKALSGTRQLSARRMCHEPAPFLVTFKPLIVANHAPKLDHVDEAMRQRVHVVPFSVRFRGTDKEDPRLAEKLEAEKAGILQWAVEGCLMWQREGLNPPPAVLKASQAYIEIADTFEGWLQENTEEGLLEEAFVSTDELFKLWLDACRSSNEDPGDKRDFRARLLEKRPHLKEGRSPLQDGKRRGFKGIRLKKTLF